MRLSCCGRCDDVVDDENCADDDDVDDTEEEEEVFSLFEAANVEAAAVFDTALNKPNEFFPASTVISTLLFLPKPVAFMFCD